MGDVEALRTKEGSHKSLATLKSKQTTDRNGRVTTYAYDADDRKTGETWVAASPSETITYTYDNASRLTKVTDAFSTYDYGYDNANRLTSADDSGTSGLPLVTLTYGYDADSDRASMDDSLGGLTSYAYDVRDELTTLTQSGSGVASKSVNFAFDADGNVITSNRYSDTTGTTKVIGTTYAYDHMDRLTGITDKNSSGTVVSSYAYTLDAASRVTQTVKVWTSGGGTATDTLAYSYTNNNQVTQVTHTNGSFATESFGYDSNGNRNTTGYSTGTGNEISSDGTYNYGYDNEGNLTSKTTISSGNQVLYKYDYRNRLTEVDQVVSGVTTTLATYTYDAWDRRIGVAEGGATTWTLYDGKSTSPILDFNGSGTQTARYLNGPTPAGVDGVLTRETSGSTVAWYLDDRLGSVGDVVNNSGGLIDHIDYGAFGNVLAETSPSSGDRFKFAGMQADTVTSLYYDNARWYDSQGGKFISQDPMEFTAGDSNIYRYVANNPENTIDPTGLGGLDDFFPGHLVIAPGFKPGPIVPGTKPIQYQPEVNNGGPTSLKPIPAPSSPPVDVDFLYLPQGVIKIPGGLTVTLVSTNPDGTVTIKITKTNYYYNGSPVEFWPVGSPQASFIDNPCTLKVDGGLMVGGKPAIPPPKNQWYPPGYGPKSPPKPSTPSRPNVTPGSGAYTSSGGYPPSYAGGSQQ